MASSDDEEDGGEEDQQQGGDRHVERALREVVHLARVRVLDEEDRLGEARKVTDGGVGEVVAGRARVDGHRGSGRPGTDGSRRRPLQRRRQLLVGRDLQGAVAAAAGLDDAHQAVTDVAQVGDDHFRWPKLLEERGQAADLVAADAAHGAVAEPGVGGDHRRPQRMAGLLGADEQHAHRVEVLPDDGGDREVVGAAQHDVDDRGREPESDQRPTRDHVAAQHGEHRGDQPDEEPAPDDARDAVAVAAHPVQALDGEDDDHDQGGRGDAQRRDAVDVGAEEVPEGRAGDGGEQHGGDVEEHQRRHARRPPQVVAAEQRVGELERRPDVAVEHDLAYGHDLPL